MSKYRKSRSRCVLVTKRLPKRFGISVHAAKGRSLVRRKYRHKAGRRYKRHMKYQRFISSCMKHHKSRHFRRGGKMKMCARRYKRGLKP